MLKLKQKIALVLALILALGAMVPVQAEDLAERIRKLTQRESAPTETEPAPQQEDTGLEEAPVAQDAPLTEEAVQDEGQQAASDEEDELVLDDEAVSSRAAFAPGLMMVEARTEVYADSRMITLLGVIINNSIVYAVSQSGSAIRIALVSGREVIEGFVVASSLSAMSKSAKSTYVMAASRGIRVYDQKLMSISFTKASGSVTAVPHKTATPTVTSTSKITATPLATATPKATATATPTAKVTAAPTVKATAVPNGYPVILEQPASISGMNGGLVVLRLKAQNTKTYQWQVSKDQGASWENLTNNSVWFGNQKASMFFSPSSTYESYLFRCKLTNSVGTVYTNVVTMYGSAPVTPTVAPTVKPTTTPTVKPTALPTVKPTAAPTAVQTTVPVQNPTATPAASQVKISAQPKDISASAGQRVTISVQAENATAYQWYYFDSSSSLWKLLSDGSVWSGARSTALSFTASASYHGGRFRCLVSGHNSSVYSDIAVFSLLTGAPVIDTSTDTVIKTAIGSYVTLTAKVSGATSCQWQINPNIGVWMDYRVDADTSDLSSPALTVRLLNSTIKYTYRLKATNAYGTTYSPVYSMNELLPGPTNVRAAAAGRNAINVSWTESKDTRTRRYLVYVNTDNTVDYQSYVTVTGNSAQLTGLNAGTTYHVWVQAEGRNLSSEVDDSVHTSVTTYAQAAKPGAPTSVSANPSTTSAAVSWKKPVNSEVDGYYVYYSLPSSNTVQKVTVSGEDNLSTVLTGLSRNTAYQVWVTAYNAAGEGNASARVSFTTLKTVAAPAQPTNVKAVSTGSNSVQVTWTRSASGDVSGYYVYYGTSATSASKYGTTYSANTTSATITGLTTGKDYYFWVTAFNGDGVQSAMNQDVRSSAVPKGPSTSSSSNKINAEYFSKMGDKYIGTSYAVYDCQAFVEKMLSDAGLNYNLAGSNAWYRQMSWRGTPEQCIAKFGCIPTGAFLFIVKHDGGEPSHYNDSLGNASHIGVVTHRNGGAIHSSYSRGGVYTSVFNDATIPNGGWNMIGLWTRMDYGETVNSILEGR